MGGGYPEAYGRPVKKSTLFWHNYEKIGKCGSGVYGKVYKVRRRAGGDDKILAVKKTNIEDRDGVSATTIREILALKALSGSPFIVKLLDYEILDQRVFVVMEYSESDLHQFIKKHNGPLPEGLVRAFTLQMFLALLHLRKHRLMHRDLKPCTLRVESSIEFSTEAILPRGSNGSLPSARDLLSEK
ncbi:Cyclin-dependent kinase B1-1 [Blyttiomyces sp. JEL0837]|nr:Cyclin-dependent kinase B1-1 [Blyttiomyces sp. JEL0837]